MKVSCIKVKNLDIWNEDIVVSIVKITCHREIYVITIQYLENITVTSSQDKIVVWHGFQQVLKNDTLGFWKTIQITFPGPTAWKLLSCDPSMRTKQSTLSKLRFSTLSGPVHPDGAIQFPKNQNIYVNVTKTIHLKLGLLWAKTLHFTSPLKLTDLVQYRAGWHCWLMCVISLNVSVWKIKYLLKGPSGCIIKWRIQEATSDCHLAIYWMLKLNVVFSWRWLRKTKPHIPPPQIDFYIAWLLKY